MTDQTCHRCGEGTTTDRWVCEQCGTIAAADLRDAADFLDNLDDKRARRRSQLWIGGGSTSANPGLPYDTRVHPTAARARNTLTTWARLIIDEHGCRDLPRAADSHRLQKAERELAVWADIAERDDLSRSLARTVRAFRTTLLEDIDNARAHADMTDLASVARWIADHTEWATAKAWAHELFQAAADLRADLRRLFDNPPETLPLGECGTEYVTPTDERATCTHTLDVPIDAATYDCPHCGHTHDVQQRRLDALRQADNLTVTIAEAVRLMRLAGHTLDRRDIGAAIHHFGIQSPWSRTIPDKPRPVPVYPLGSVREAIEQMETDPETRRAVAAVRRGGRGATADTLHASA